MTIRNPVEWGVDSVRATALAAQSTFDYTTATDAADPEVRRIGIEDLKTSLREGWRDFEAYRTDVLFLCLIYPLAGLILARFTLNHLLPLVFPIVAGFALIGPFAAAGLYEMSRRRERGQSLSWVDAFGVFGSPSFGAIAVLGALMTGIFLVWLWAAMAIYNATLGPDLPTSVVAFAGDVFATPAGWALIGIGVGVGFLFALLVLSVSAVSFPLLIDRRVGVLRAVLTSIRAMSLNPIPMFAWGMIVAGLLVLGTIPGLLGLIVVMPVLGHATWHLYRKVVV